VEGVPIKDTMLSEMCPDVEAAFCFPQKYRTSNGECNNVKNPMWGVTGAAYLRAMEPQYDDGVGTPRTVDSDGNALPDALVTVFVNLHYGRKVFRLIFTVEFPTIFHQNTADK
jgi:hypothetical protein